MTVKLDYGTDARPNSGLLGRGVLGLTDQAIISAGNFLTTILLARRLSEETFGTYSILWQLLIVLNNLHFSLVSYPLTVRGAGGGESTVRRLLLPAVKMTALLVVIWLLPLGIASFATSTLNILPIILIALLLWQTQDLARRALMAQQRFELPILGDALSYVGQAAIVFLVVTPNSSLRLIFVIMAGTSLAAAMVQLFQRPPLRPALESSRQFVTSGWKLGRWLLLNNLLNMVNIQVVMWSVAYFHGAVAIGTLAAVSGILGITHPALMGLTGMMLPGVAHATAAGGKYAALRTAGFYAGLGALLLLPVWLVLMIFPGFTLDLFFAGKYADATLPLRLLVIFYVIDFVGRMIESTLNSMQENPASSAANVAAAIVTACVTIPLTYLYSINGAILGGWASVLARLLVGAYFLKRAVNQPMPSQRSASS